MNTELAVTAAVFVGGLAATALGDLVSEEIRSRLDGLPAAVLRLAAVAMPRHLRTQCLEEWQGELYEFLRGAERGRSPA